MKKKLIKLRKRVNELFFNYHLSKSMIAKKKKVSRDFVIRWTGSPTQDFTEDNQGASHYLCYPEYTIYHLLGERVLEADFVGKKYITARSEPLNFIGFSFKKEPRLKLFQTSLRTNSR
ncbi:MAG: hypothetical protein QME07_03825 [bacterium]|nr:hypothetical protein [bacterium]